MKNTLLIFFLALNNIGIGQILNGSFENWTFIPGIDGIQQPWVLNDWVHCNKQGDPIPMDAGLPGTYKDSMAQSGSFALTLYRWYGNSYEITKFKNQCTTTPEFLNGFYKYSDNALTSGTTDTASVAVFLTKYNSSQQIIDTIGSGQIELVTADQYTLFQCPIVYTQPNITPDSISIIIKPSKFGSGIGIPICLSGNYCSYLTIDNLSLSISTNTTEEEVEKPFVVFPNPASSDLSIVGNILHQKMTVINVLGEIILVKAATSNHETLEIKNLPAGIYYLNVNGRTEKFVVE